MQFWAKSKYLCVLGNRAGAELPLLLVLCLPPCCSSRSHKGLLKCPLSPFGLTSRTAEEWLLVICIQVYECRPPTPPSPKSGSHGKRLSLHISIVRTTSCSLFLMTAGLCSRKWQFPAQWGVLFLVLCCFFLVELPDIFCTWTWLCCQK